MSASSSRLKHKDYSKYACIFGEIQKYIAAERLIEQLQEALIILG